MAKFKFNGIDDLQADLEQVAQIDDDTKWRILSAGADVVKTYQQQSILDNFKQRTYQLFGSIKVKRKVSGGEIKAVISPQGKRTRASIGIRRYQGHRNGSYQGTNAEVAYILEFGSPRIKARHWMEKANEASTDETNKAMMDVWDMFLRSHNL